MTLYAAGTHTETPGNPAWCTSTTITVVVSAVHVAASIAIIDDSS